MYTPKVGDTFLCMNDAGRSNVTRGKKYRLTEYEPSMKATVTGDNGREIEWNTDCFVYNQIKLFGMVYFKKVNVKVKNLPEWW